MHAALIPPAEAVYLGIPGIVWFSLIPAIGIGTFLYIIYRRLVPLMKAAPDFRFNRVTERAASVLKLWLAQYRHPRYMLAGVLHITLFAGFLILSLRSLTLIFIGINPDFVLPGFDGPIGHAYNILKDLAGTLVFFAAIFLILRRAFFQPARYEVPSRYGKPHTAEAILVLCLITGLVTCDFLFEGSLAAANLQKGLPAEWHLPGTGGWLVAAALSNASLATLQTLHLGGYFAHELIFFFFLCFLPLGKHFHVVTSLFNVYFLKLDKGTVKPVRWGVADEQLDDLESFGTKTFEDFTWKHILDFYSCADCGRCSDNCPANAVGRPLSPRFISIKCRDHGYKRYPLVGRPAAENQNLIGGVLEEDEIWSCTTCGACEQECPLTIEYIDKIVDVRRGLVDEGMVPQSLQKPLQALEKRGNPWGKMERKRADWTKAETFAETCQVKVLDKKASAEAIYFVDSITSFDDRMQEIARATSCILDATGIDFGILGKAEKDSGHEARRFGEEMLFQELKDSNTEAILSTGARRIITADPHAYNALKKDYRELPPVAHISEVIVDAVANGSLKLNPNGASDKVYTYHDPCYLDATTTCTMRPGRPSTPFRGSGALICSAAVTARFAAAGAG